MLNFIDISHYQAGINLPALDIDAVVCKATEGIGFVDHYCDDYIQTAIKLGLPFGFYHFARNNDPKKEAAFFIKHTKGYYGKGVPILDWEAGQTVKWVNTFVRKVHSETGVWPWIYANPWRFDQGEVEPNCMRWVAKYPNVKSPTFEQAKKWQAPKCDGLVGAWQFCSDGRLKGYSGKLDCNLFYGDKKAWSKYGGNSNSSSNSNTGSDGSNSSNNHSNKPQVLENQDYIITIKEK